MEGLGAFFLSETTNAIVTAHSPQGNGDGMTFTGNTILITGGGSGIGRALAESFHRLGNKVVIAGRRREALDETTRANPGMESVQLDVADPASIADAAVRIRARYPQLNFVIHNAGIMKLERMLEGPSYVHAAEATIASNLLGPIRLNAALLPLLREQPNAIVMTVSSGLAFIPRASFPTYCATKAAIHSYSQSLRYQLRDTAIRVVELIPPYVQTELTGADQARDPNAMPLQEFIEESMRIFMSSPDVTEICVDRVKALRFAERGENYAAFFASFNDRLSAAEKAAANR
jgi:uncharacterized oxidoreductase